MELFFIVVLIFLGLLFCVVELLILPGVSLGGLLSVVSFGVAIYNSFLEYGLVGGSVVVLIVLVLLSIAIIFSLRARTWDRFSLKSEIDSSSSLKPQAVVNVGQRGRTISRLSPMGKIEIEGQHFEAKSSEGYIDAKTEIEVIGFDNSSVIVKQL